MTSDEYRGAVLAVVSAIPPGRVMSYGAIADYLAEVSGRRSCRLIGQILARTTQVVPWHRVVRHDGRPARGHEPRAIRLLLDEGAPLARDRVSMAAAAWSPAVAASRFLSESLQPPRAVISL